MSRKWTHDKPDANAGAIIAFLKIQGIEVVRTDRPVDCLIANNGKIGWLEIKTDDPDAKIKRSQLEFMSETSMPCAFAKNEGEALIFAERMEGLTQTDKDKLAAFLVRNQGKEWRPSVIEKVIKL